MSCEDDLGGTIKTRLISIGADDTKSSLVACMGEKSDMNLANETRQLMEISR